MKNKVTVIIVTLSIVAVLSVVALSTFLVLNNREEFTGSRERNPFSYILDIEYMNGADTRAMELSAGDKLEIRFKTEKGKMHMEIKAPDGTTFYTGNGKEATDFTVNISKCGAYSIYVEAHHAKGIIHIRRVPYSLRGESFRDLCARNTCKNYKG